MRKEGNGRHYIYTPHKIRACLDGLQDCQTFRDTYTQIASEKAGHALGERTLRAAEKKRYVFHRRDLILLQFLVQRLGYEDHDHEPLNFR